MQNFPRQLAMQSCVLCSFVRCGTSKQIEKKKKKKRKVKRLKVGGVHVHADQTRNIPEEFDVDKHGIHLIPCYKRYLSKLKNIFLLRQKLLTEQLYH